MALHLNRPGPGRRLDEGRVLRGALVNNMPDSAFVATERQFLGLVEAGSEDVDVEVSRYSFAGVPRGPRIEAYQADEYFPIEGLWDSAPDLVIVTGSEPRAEALEGEPYWPESLRLLAWAQRQPTSMLMSCLAAHFALYVYDGIERTALPAKCTGVFAQEIDPSSPLTAGMTAPVVVPHSRLNDVSVSSVAAAGYHVLLAGPEAGWTALSAVRQGSDILALQGHPEYDATSLLREYRRDAGRYLSFERDALPVLPTGCVGPDDLDAIGAFHQRVCTGRRDAAVMEEFDFDGAARRAPWPWRSTATVLYRNWIRQIAARRLRPAPAIPNETR